MANQYKKRGDIVAPNLKHDWISGSLSDGGSAGGVISVANPEDSEIVIDKVIIDLNTASNSSATVDIGVAANGSTSSDNLLDGLDVNSSTGVFDNIDDQGTNGQATVPAGSGDFVTGSQASGDVTGLAGKYYIRYRALS